MAKVIKSLSEYKQADREVQALLRSIEPANSVIIYHELFLKQAHHLEKVLNRLKAFLKMLSSLAKLNPLKYREWWHNAYANPVTPAPKPVVEPAPTQAPATSAALGSQVTPPTPDRKVQKDLGKLPPRSFQH